MKQIKNGFKDYYYLTTNGKVINTNTDNWVCERHHTVKLKAEDGSFKNISIKELYKLVYGQIFCIDEIEPLENEVFKEIEYSNGEYFISNLGRIKSYLGYKAIILKPSENKNGYLRVQLMENGIKINKLVHQLVANAWLGSPKTSDTQIHHKDFNKKNNILANLEYLSPKEHRCIHAERRKNNG